VDQLEAVLDVVKAVGQRGHFLAQKHTRDQIRTFHLSQVQRQKDEKGQPKDPRKIALEIFKDIEANHQPEPLPDHKLMELDKIIDAAENEAGDIFGS
jgi:trimethylamine:corrinoid methyltransferase-like protein